MACLINRKCLWCDNYFLADFCCDRYVCEECEARQRAEKTIQKLQIISAFTQLEESMEALDPEFSLMIDNHFWELV